MISTSPLQQGAAAAAPAAAAGGCFAVGDGSAANYPHQIGIRPAPGYPSCPEHTEKQIIWDLLEVEQRIGMKLTESYAMWPAASVCGWYFTHPASNYFTLGRIDEDQAVDYAKRKGWNEREMVKWLGVAMK